MKYKKILIIPFILGSVIAPIAINNINNNQTNIISTSLKAGNVTTENSEEPTEEQIKIAQQQFWMEFGITAGVLGVIIITCLIVLFVKKKRKR